LDLLTYAAIAFCISFLTTFGMMHVKILDVPSQRSSHTIPTPRTGGIAVLSGFYGALFSMGMSWSTPFWDMRIPIFSVLIGSALIAVLGFVDDFKSLGSNVRLFLQLVIASSVLLSGASIHELSLPFFPDLKLSFVGSLLSLFWIIGFLNAFNFMDGINGITGTIAAISCINLIIIASFYHNLAVLHFLIPLLFAALGFLYFNFPKGRIFLGDAGSQFIGFLFATLMLLLTKPTFGSISFWTFPLLFFFYLYDTAFTLIRRFLKKANLLQAHREHLYQLLNQSGWSHGQVTSLYGLFFMLQGAACIAMQFFSSQWHIFFYIPFLGLAFGYTLWVMKKAKKAGVSL
jgi:UDP-N-acetylmuramyl pentapeptide phosphotransferase/UDP-N-acetylglucosamine-1-phosphate transferase